MLLIHIVVQYNHKVSHEVLEVLQLNLKNYLVWV